MKIFFVAVFDSEGKSTNNSQARGFEAAGHEVYRYSFRERAQKIGDQNRDFEIRDRLEEENPEALLADGLDNALVGVYRPRWTEELPIAVYSLTKTISELVEQGMDEEEAVEYFDYNIEGAYMGEYTPMFIDDTGV